MSDQSPFKKIVTRALLAGILLSSVAALVLTGNSDTLRSSIGNRNVAKIGDQLITAQQFEVIYARRVAQSGLDEATARKMGVPSMVLQQEIERQTLLQAAQKLGIRIDNRYIATQLKNQLEQLQLPGTPQEKLQVVLQQQRITEKELVELLRGDFAINVLASTATTGDIQVPDALLRSAYQAEREKRSAEIITITENSLKDQKPLTAKEIEAYYKENGEKYRTAEQRDVVALVLPQSLFVKEVSVSDEDAQIFYDDHASQFMGPERVRLEQVIVATEKEAEKIVDAKPESLATLNEKQYLKPDWYTKATLPKEFSEILYPAKPVGLLKPVKTSLGWHVLRVAEYEEAKPQTFAQVREAILRQLKDDKLDEQMNSFTNELDNAIAEGESLQDIAKKYDLKPVVLSGLKAGEAIKNPALSAPLTERVQEAAFTLQDGETSPLLDTSEESYLLVQVTKVTPSAIPELAAVKATVTADARKNHQVKALLNKAEELIGLYDASKPGAFEKAVTSSGLIAKSIPLQTKAEITEDHDAQLAELIFTLGTKNTLSYTQEAGKVNLVRLRGIVQSRDVPDPKTSETLRETVKDNMTRELQQQFLAAWQKDLRVSVNMDTVQAMFEPQNQE